MHFLRMFNNTSLNAWDSKEDAALAQDVFREAFKPGAGRPSLYRVDSLADEIRTAAAFALTPPDKDLKNLFVVRLFEQDLNELHLLVDEGPGTTGVVDIDFRHFEVANLTGPKAISLTARVRNGASAGEERFRWVAARFQCPHLEQFLLLPDEQVIAEAKRRCRFKLGLGPAPEQGGAIKRILTELAASRPTLPRPRVERAAFLNYCGRLQSGLSGDQDGDWTKAEEGLHDAYKQAFRS
jgi:hypothetical protein